MNGVASVLSKQGKYAEAEKMHQETLALREKVSGKEHPFTLTSINNLAWTLSSQGKYAEAISIMQQCVQLREQILGSQHSHTKSLLRTRNKWQLET
jgi:tetratricopeptide (TPR) repeat protein